jgi:hypothetical protein
MPDIPFGQILILIAFILFPLINWLFQRMQRRLDSQAPRQPPPQPAPRTYAKPTPMEVIASSSARVPAPDKRESPAPPAGRLRKKRFFTSRRDLRRAFILMTVLGPCRAVDSADAEQRQMPQ